MILFYAIIDEIINKIFIKNREYIKTIKEFFIYIFIYLFFIFIILVEKK